MTTKGQVLHEKFTVGGFICEISNEVWFLRPNAISYYFKQSLSHFCKQQKLAINDRPYSFILLSQTANEPSLS